MKFSPLFWPIILKGSIIYILDETLLPQSLSYIKVTDYKQACYAIKQMKTRALGQVLLVFYTFLLVIRQNKNNNLNKSNQNIYKLTSVKKSCILGGGEKNEF